MTPVAGLRCYSVCVECDFCSSPNVVTRYQCRDFESESKDAGVLYQEARFASIPTNVVLKSIDYWAACQACAAFVEKEDLEGLLGRIFPIFEARYRHFSVGARVHIRHTYELFFANRIRVSAAQIGAQDE